MSAEQPAAKRLKFSSSYDSSKVRMFEVSDDVIASLDQHGSLRIAGPNEAHLCSHDKTYQIRFLEYSNTQLLAPPEPDCINVAAGLNGSCFIYGHLV